MHPGYKLAKFKQFNYSGSWINAARKLVREEFDARYASAPEIISDDEAAIRACVNTPVHLMLSPFITP